MKEILMIILFTTLFLAIVLAILFHERVRNFKKVLKKAADERAARKQAEEDEYFKRTSTKNYHKKEEQPSFSEDYFRGVEPKSEEKTTPKEEPQKESTTYRNTATDGGVTIIDERTEQKPDRKIFDVGEGEYVDYVEVSS
jgi:hypothetical protein